MQRLYPSIRLVGITLTSNIKNAFIDELFVEGMNGYFTRLIINPNSQLYFLYKNAAFFYDAITCIMEGKKPFIDPLSDYQPKQHLTGLSTQQLIQQLPYALKTHQIIYLQLNAAGFSRKEIATLMVKQESTIKYYIATLLQQFNAERNADLVCIALSNGIIKYNKFYNVYNTNHLASETLKDL